MNVVLEFQFRKIFLLPLIAIVQTAPHSLTVFLQTGKKDGMVNRKLSKLRHLLPPAYLGGTLALAGAVPAGAAATLL